MDVFYYDRDRRTYVDLLLDGDQGALSSRLPLAASFPLATCDRSRPRRQARQLLRGQERAELIFGPLIQGRVGLVIEAEKLFEIELPLARASGLDLCFDPLKRTLGIAPDPLGDGIRTERLQRGIDIALNGDECGT